MTKQETFDRVVRALMLQGRRSQIKTPSGLPLCVYRHPEGLKCAAGHLIDDEDYVTEMEGTLASGGMVGRALRKNGHDIKLVCDLQSIHDGWEPSEWPEKLRLLAWRHRLSPAVCPQICETPK